MTRRCRRRTRRSGPTRSIRRGGRTCNGVAACSSAIGCVRWWMPPRFGFAGDCDLAEDCAQEAFEARLATWPRDRVPHRPGAWLTTAARNRATDRLRRAAAGAARLRQAAVLGRDPDEPPVEEIPDERL